MRQRRWVEVLNDYDCEICYHEGKANVVADTLSRKEQEKPKRVRALRLDLQIDLFTRIKESQKLALQEPNLEKEGLGGMIDQLVKGIDGILRMNKRIWVPIYGKIWEERKVKSFIGPFKILKRVEPVAYQLELPKEINGVHDVFHVSNLRKCLADESLVMPLQDVEVDEKLRFMEQPLQIEDRQEKKLKRKKLMNVKVKWNSRRGPEYMLKHFPVTNTLDR
ncbi:hypothetical protein L1987_42491 [Smallanthus sonchifolius]|uniref:Uncharacterized protein n=1 Tax=Smallanthus sonchifolius TaxID=185202 RepID=A0ACB9GK65_9ASTR|nr:hypothetical protein L1987_42491 [Smallanthus sonchifolius]